MVLLRRVARRALRATQPVGEGTDVRVVGRPRPPGLAHRADQAAVPEAGVAATPVSNSAQQERQRVDVVVFAAQNCAAAAGSSKRIPQGLSAPTLTKAL